MIQRITLISAICLLVGCASQQASTQLTAQAQSISSKCAVTVIQDGRAIQGKPNGRIQFYDLKGAPFRLEVPSLECHPSVGVIPSFSDFRYVAQSPLVVTVAGFGIASSNEDRDVLFHRGDSPRLIDGFEDLFSSLTKEYEALCTEFRQCPLQIRAIRNYQNFVGEQEGTKTTYADFKRLNVRLSLNGYRGDVPVVVYTDVKDISDGMVNVLETHPMVLRFK